MNNSLYGTSPVPIVASQFSRHHMEQQPRPNMSQEFYPPNPDISPRCLPVQSIEGPSTLDLSNHPRYDMQHALRSIPETDRPTSYNPSADALMQSFMAATHGAFSMHHNNPSMAAQDPSYAFGFGVPKDFPREIAFSVPNAPPNEHASNGLFHGDFAALGYNTLDTTNTASSAEAQNSAGSISSEQSPFSGAPPTATPQSGAPSASSVNALASVYSNYEQEPEEPGFLQADGEDSLDFPYNVPQASTSDHALSSWDLNGQNQTYSQPDMYEHPNASAQGVLSSPDQSDDQKLNMASLDFEALPTFGDDVYSRRNSSTTNLASNIEAIHIQNSHTGEDFKQPNQPSSIAARRQKRPTALNSSTLRSSSYTTGMHSPGANSEHTLRRIRSSGIPNASGRIQKAPGSAQRSPMAMTFADAAASPKFARTFSSTSTAAFGQGGSLAPPTPQTPNEFSRVPHWQGNAAIRNNGPMPEHSSPQGVNVSVNGSLNGSVNVNYCMDPRSSENPSVGTSPPSTPLDLGRYNQARLGHDNIYRDTPPQSAPATQQSFRTTFAAPQMRAESYSAASELTLAQPKPSHGRRPSLPDGGLSLNPTNEFQMQYFLGGSMYDGDFGDMSLNGITHNVPFAPRPCWPDFQVHQFSPPQESGPGFPHRNIPDQQKTFVFANQGPGDFR